jgi:hypothetical protein
MDFHFSCARRKIAGQLDIAEPLNSRRPNPGPRRAKFTGR